AVQRDRRVVGQGDAGVRAMHVLPPQRVEQCRVERAADATAGTAIANVDGRLDRRVVSRLVAELAARRITDDFLRDDGDEQAVSSGGRVVREPRLPLLDGERLGVERDVRVLDVVVVEGGQRRQVTRLSWPN